MLSFCPNFNAVLRSGIFLVLETVINQNLLLSTPYELLLLLHKSLGNTPCNQRIQNILITIYKCLSYDSFPKYLKDILTLHQSEYSFRSTNTLKHFVKPVTNTYGLNSFCYCGSKSWNSLPNNVRSEPTLTRFRRLLKLISFQT